MNDHIVNTENKAPHAMRNFDPDAVRSAEKAINVLLPSGKGAVMITGDCHVSGALTLPAMPLIVSSESQTDEQGDQNHLDYIFMFCDSETTTPDLRECFSAAYRILHQKGALVVAFFDAGSRAARDFYPELETEEPQLERIMFELSHCGFRHFEFAQAIFGPGQVPLMEYPRAGYGEGLFVVVQATKKLTDFP